MSGRIERTIRIVQAGEALPRRTDYWRTRSREECLAETLKLHREGNELFRGGNPPFVFTITSRDGNDH